MGMELPSGLLTELWWLSKEECTLRVSWVGACTERQFGPEQLLHVFDRYFRGPAKHRKGAGLGSGRSCDVPGWSVPRMKCGARGQRCASLSARLGWEEVGLLCCRRRRLHGVPEAVALWRQTSSHPALWLPQPPQLSSGNTPVAVRWLLPLPTRSRHRSQRLV